MAVRGLIATLLVTTSLTTLMAHDAMAQDADAKIELLQKTLEDLLRRDAERDREMETLRRELATLRRQQQSGGGAMAHGGGKADADHSHSAHSREGESNDVFVGKVGDTTVRLKGLGVETRAAFGYTSEEGENVEGLQGGEHDPTVNGFTLRAAELSAAGAVDGYFDAKATMKFALNSEGETAVELEEAWLQTQGPLKVKAGQFRSDFGIYNVEHHNRWADDPVIYNRLLGPDGTRAPGVQVGYEFAGLGRVSLSAQQPTGETMSSFLANDEFYQERPIGGRTFSERDVDFGHFTYGGRIASGGKVGDGVAVRGGLSALTGPNASGANANTWIYGLDVGVHADIGGGRYLDFALEAMRRSFDAAEEPGGAAGDKLLDHGLYATAEFGFAEGLAAGLRFDYATGSGESVGTIAGRDADRFRSDRMRLSPLVSWSFAPKAEVTVQYNYDQSDFLDGDTGHAAWVGFNWSFGAGDYSHGGHDHAHGAHDHSGHGHAH